VLEVFNVDGSVQSVSLHPQVRAEEVSAAIGRRLKLLSKQGSNEGEDFGAGAYSLCTWLLRADITGESEDSDGKKVKIVEIRRLDPDQKPCEVKSSESARIETMKLNSGSKFEFLQGFAFLDEEGMETFHKDGPDIIAKALRSNARVQKKLKLAKEMLLRSSRKIEAEESYAATAALADLLGRSGSPDIIQRENESRNERKEFLPIKTQRGERSGYLFQKSAANPREWQRRWCVLKGAELIHSLSNQSDGDGEHIKLTQSKIRALLPRDIGGLKFCFEIDTPKDVVQFRAKTEQEANSWITSIKKNMELASENEKFVLAELIIQDGQRMSLRRDENLIRKSLASLDGLLSTLAGAQLLFQFSKEGQGDNKSQELVSFAADLERALTIFSSIQSEIIDRRAIGAGAVSVGSHRSHRGPLRGGLFGTQSVASSGSSMSLFRGSAASLARYEWIIQICDRFISLFETKHDDETSSKRPEVSECLDFAERIRRQAADESQPSIARQICLDLFHAIRTITKQAIENGVYRDFKNSPGYFLAISSIPNRLKL